MSDETPPQQQFTDQEIIEAVKAHEPVGTSEVAEAVGATRRTMGNRLDELAESGAIEKKIIGQSSVWFTE